MEQRVAEDHPLRAVCLIPRVSIMGFDDLDRRSPSQSYQLGTTATRLLLDRKEGDTSPGKHIVFQRLVVEDSLTGVLSAKHAGCCVSALTRTFPGHELLGVGADFIFEDFQSLKRSAEIEKYCR
ncbi:hypothetical protein [Edaphobacter modestus]|uniref:hypothetical protein n=1 Tax=Edaphobacter modestus TaxID=388466 RepID=UPI00102C0CF4|nr:hypothetical protein [Edaphobacter modestus]